MMLADPVLWHQLCIRLADISAAFSRCRSGAGAAAVQLFDSWAGSLSAADYARFAQPYSGRLLQRLAPANVPRIHFGVGTSEQLGLMADAGAEVVGWIGGYRSRRPAAELVRPTPSKGIWILRCGSPWPVLAERVREVILRAAAPGHVFNLGHECHPTPTLGSWRRSWIWCTPRGPGSAPKRARGLGGVMARVVVVGGGISVLSRRGRWSAPGLDVILAERGSLGRQDRLDRAGWRPAGHRC